MSDGRDLLVGLVAVEKGLLSRKQMHAQFEAWRSEDAKNSFAKHLASLPDIESADIQAVESEILSRMEGDPEYLRGSIWRCFMKCAADEDAEVSVHLEQTMSEFLVEADTSAIDPHLASSIDWMSGSLGETNITDGFGHSGSRTQNEPPPLVETNLWLGPDNDEDGNRYSRTRVHSQGGLGRVWLARDHTLNREVALKEIRDDRGVTAEKVRRFMREAQITGQLEHPNIIPVYELAANTSESPYYTMRFLRGGTLSEKITDYQKSKTPGWHSLELTQLLSAFVGVCHAMAYSHSRGVIHRDLKPDNIMLGAFGEVILLDWGLAKTVDEVIGAEEQGVPSVEVVGDAAVDRTQFGQIVGTVNYMAPEQACGDLRRVGPATDIYGLGGILYAILTGCAPHHRLRDESRDGSTRAILHQIATQEAPSLREIDSTIPKALDAICAKAMARSTKDRYETATQLAEDVQRWLADEPVSVHHPPFRERAVRWMRRHKSWTVATATALLLVSVISTSAAVMVNRARGAAVQAQGRAEDSLAKEQKALIAETKARNDALRMLRKAREAVDRSFTGVSMVLKNYPGVQLLRVELLKQAAADYASFAEEEGDLPELQLETARAFSRLGDVHALIGNPQESESAYETAEAKYRELLPLLVDSSQASVELSDTLSTLGSLRAARHEFPEARKLFNSAEEVLRFVKVDAETESSDREDRAAAVKLALAALQLNAAIVPHIEGELDQAKTQLQVALAAFRELADSSNSAVHKAGLANAHRRMGKLHVELGHHEQAIADLRRAADLFDRLWDDHEDLQYLEGAAECVIDIGNAARLAGDEDGALKHYANGLERYGVLLEARPGVPTYREMQAILAVNMAQVYNRQAYNSQALEAAEGALATFEDLVLSTPADTSVPQYLLERGVAAATLAIIERDMNAKGSNGIDKSLARSQEAIDDFAKLSSEFETIVEYKRRLAVARAEAARTLSTSGSKETALINNLYSSAISAYEKILEGQPANPSTEDKLASACMYYAEWLIQFEERKADASKLFARSAGLRSRLEGSAEQLDRRAWLLCRCPDEKFRDLPIALELANSACTKSSRNARYRCTLGLAHLANDQMVEAVNAFEIARSQRAENAPHALELFGLAIAHARQGENDMAATFFEEAQAAEGNSPGNPEVLSLKREAEATLKQP